MKKIIFLTTHDAENGFSLAGITHHAVNPAEVGDELKGIMAEPDNGLVIIDERLVRGEVEEHLREMAVNVQAPLGLLHRMGRRLRDRGRGGVVLMGSLSVYHGAPWVAHYGATKAWTISLGEALAVELEPAGIDVLVACAGVTRTPNFLATHPRRTGLVPVPVQSPEEVAEEALDSLGRRPVRITGVANRIGSFVMRRLLPRAWSVRWIGRTTRKMYPSR